MNTKETTSRQPAPMNLSWFICLHVAGIALLYVLFSVYLSDVQYLYIPTKAVGVIHMTARRFCLIHLVTLAGIVCTMPDERTCLRAAKNVLAPYGLLFAVQLFPKWPLVMCILVAFGLVYTVLALLESLTYPLETKTLSHRILLRGMLFATDSVNVLCGCLAGVIVFCVGATGTSAAKIVDPFAEVPANGTEEIVHTSADEAAETSRPLLAQGDVLHLLQPENRQNMTDEELRAVCQAVADMEAEHLGLSTGSTVLLNDLPEATLGRYCRAQHTIQINRSHAREGAAMELLDTILHESHHSYVFSFMEAVETLPPEYRDLLVMREAAVYTRAVEEYVSGAEDYEAYCQSPLEISARDYATSRLQTYLTASKGSAA